MAGAVEAVADDALLAAAVGAVVDIALSADAAGAVVVADAAGALADTALSITSSIMPFDTRSTPHTHLLFWQANRRSCSHRLDHQPFHQATRRPRCSDHRFFRQALRRPRGHRLRQLIAIGQIADGGGLALLSLAGELSRLLAKGQIVGGGDLALLGLAGELARLLAIGQIVSGGGLALLGLAGGREKGFDQLATSSRVEVMMKVTCSPTCGSGSALGRWTAKPAHRTRSVCASTPCSTR